VDRREDARRSNSSGSAKAGFKEAMTSSNVKPVHGGKDRLICAPRLRPARQARAAPQQALESIARQSIYPNRSKRGVIGMLTSNGIPAAASFLVGIAPSKTLPNRQATFPLCA
jgi:hypothetical protein